MKTILFFAISLSFGAAVMAADKAGKVLIKAQVAQTAYLCESGHEASCYKLALWTGKVCSSPRQLGGCMYDSSREQRVTVIN